MNETEVRWFTSLTMPLTSCGASVPRVHLPEPMPEVVLALTIDICATHHTHHCRFCRYTTVASRVFFTRWSAIAIAIATSLAPRLLLPMTLHDQALALLISTSQMALNLAGLHLAVRAHFRRIARRELPAVITRTALQVTSPGLLGVDDRTRLLPRITEQPRSSR